MQEYLTHIEIYDGNETIELSVRDIDTHNIAWMGVEKADEAQRTADENKSTTSSIDEVVRYVGKHLFKSDFTDWLFNPAARELYDSWNPDTTIAVRYQFDGFVGDFPPIDTSNITDASYMFAAKNGPASFSLKLVPSLNLSRATKLNYCFFNCRGLTTIGNILTPQKEWSGNDMFEDCKELKELPIDDFSKCVNFRYGCHGTRNLQFIGTRFYFTNCIDLRYAFCDGGNGEISRLYAPKCTDAKGLFSGCYAEVIGEVDVSKAADVEYLFMNCGNLKRIGPVTFGTPTKSAMLAYQAYEIEFMHLKNLGATPQYDSYALINSFPGNKWGSGSEENRQSLVDTLLNDSFDRTAAGYNPISIGLCPEVLDRLTDEEKAGITAKGFTLTSY